MILHAIPGNYMILSFESVFKTLTHNKGARDYPFRSDSRCADGLLWPTCQPSFSIDPTAKPAIFTIGSCFARNIEEALQPLGFELPTRRLTTPPHERGPRRPNAVLNEFNPGTMQQRILYALSGRELAEETIVPGTDGLFSDLLLFGGVDVTWDRAIERRQEVADVYSRLSTSPYLIVTLGLVEAWFDEHTGLYVNRMPPVPFMKAQPGRYTLRRLEAEECVVLLAPAMAALAERQIRVILTVSPVPLNTTMTKADAIVADGASKAALRVCADRLCRQFAHVDYFPSYEIVKSGGLASYLDDNLHVKDDIVHRVTRFMIDTYCVPPALARPA